jgi:hypothetical protein
MFWTKRHENNFPEEIKNPNFLSGRNYEEGNFADSVCLTGIFGDMKASRVDLLADFIIYKIKNDKKFFNEFVNFLERSQNRQCLLKRILKTELIEDIKKIFSEKRFLPSKRFSCFSKID